MKRIIFILFVPLLLILSSCGGTPTGKGVVEVNEKIERCVELCDDGAHVEGYFYNSCSKILEFGGEEIFNEYLEKCK